MIREVVVIIGLSILAITSVWIYGVMIEPFAADIGACSLTGYGGGALCEQLKYMFQVFVPAILILGSVGYAWRSIARRRRTSTPVGRR